MASSSSSPAARRNTWHSSIKYHQSASTINRQPSIIKYHQTSIIKYLQSSSICHGIKIDLTQRREPGVAIDSPPPPALRRCDTCSTMLVLAITTGSSYPARGTAFATRRMHLLLVATTRTIAHGQRACTESVFGGRDAGLRAARQVHRGTAE